MSTEAQIAANRLNCQKSTGPRTEAGKAIVSRNAEKHTKLARSLLFTSQSLQEPSVEFSNLCSEYYESLEPVGPLEEMLVDRIVTAVWRMRRARRAEAGEIIMNLDARPKNRDEINPVSTLLQAAEVANREDVLRALDKTVPGCEYVLSHLRDAQAAVHRDERLTQDTFNRLNKVFRGRGKTVTDPLFKMAVTLETNPAKLDTTALLKQHQAEALSFLDRQIKYFEEIMATRRSEPDAETKARQDAAQLPAGRALDRIIRYETLLERQIFGAMNQLEKIQSRRRSSSQTPSSPHGQQGSSATMKP